MQIADVDKRIIFSPGVCGHFALDTLSETYLKDAVFDINVFGKESTRMTTSTNVKYDTKITNRIITRYCFVSINTC